MILSKLELQNFKRYKNKEFNFTEGLTGLLGKNGSGKSTIFEAILFALYGKSRVSNELLKNSYAKPKEPLSVKLYFEIEGKEYLVERELRGKSLSAKANLYDGSGELIATSVKGVNSEIVKLIGMSYEAFANTIYASQKELTALSNLKSEERKKIIRRLIGLEKIDNIEKELIYKIRDLKRDIKSFNEVLTSKEQIDEIKSQLQESKSALKILQEEIKESKKKLETHSKTVNLALQNLEKQEKLKEEYNTINSELELLKSNLQNLTSNLQEQKDRLKNLQEQEKFYNDNKDIISKYQELEKEILACQKLKEQSLKKEGLLKEQESLREQIKRLRKEIKSLSAQTQNRQALLQEYQQKQSSLKDLQNSIKNLEIKEKELLSNRSKHQAIIDSTKRQLIGIQKLGHNSACPTCTRPLLNEYESVVQNLSKTIENLTNGALSSVNLSLQKLNSQKERLNSQKVKLEEAIKGIHSQIHLIENLEKQQVSKKELFDKIMTKGLQNKDELEKLASVNYNSKKHQDLLEQKRDLEPNYKKLLGVLKVIEQIPSIKKQIEETQKSISDIQNRIEAKAKQIKEHKYNQKEEQKVKTAYQDALKQKEQIQNIISQKEVAEAKNISQIANLQNRLDEDKKQREKLKLLEQDRDDYELLKLFMGDFKTKINSQITPRISQIASDMFYEITNGKYQLIEVDDEFNFFIYDDGQKFPIERFSGGEIDLANLVLRIAISKTLNELNSNTNISLLAFDEIFGSQDEERRYILMDTFNKISEHYRQIFLISHEREIKEMFESVIEL